MSATDDVLIKRLLVDNAEVTRLKSCHVYVSVGCFLNCDNEVPYNKGGLMDLMERIKYYRNTSAWLILAIALR